MRTPEGRAFSTLTTGKGLAWADGYCFCRRPYLTSHIHDSFTGVQHARQRKAMNPVFSYGALREFLPVFHHIAQKVRSAFVHGIKPDAYTCVLDRNKVEGAGESKWTVICCHRYLFLARSRDS
jgi:hypothetical protein